MGKKRHKQKGGTVSRKKQQNVGKECHWLLSLAIYAARERWPGRHQMKEIWTVVQRKADKKQGHGRIQRVGTSRGRLWEKGYGKVQAGCQRSWGHEKPTQKEIMYVVTEHLLDKGKEEAA